jgi:hypothetical protein
VALLLLLRIVALLLLLFLLQLTFRDQQAVQVLLVFLFLVLFQTLFPFPNLLLLLVLVVVVIVVIREHARRQSGLVLLLAQTQFIAPPRLGSGLGRRLPLLPRSRARAVPRHKRVQRAQRRVARTRLGRQNHVVHVHRRRMAIAPLALAAAA